MAEKTKVMTAKDMLLEDTDAAVHLGVRSAKTYEEFRSTLRDSIQYLIDHGVLKRRRGAAHVVEAEQLPPDQALRGSAFGDQASEWEPYPQSRTSREGCRCASAHEARCGSRRECRIMHCIIG